MIQLNRNSATAFSRRITRIVRIKAAEPRPVSRPFSRHWGNGSLRVNRNGGRLFSIRIHAPLHGRRPPFMSADVRRVAGEAIVEIRQDFAGVEAGAGLGESVVAAVTAGGAV